MMGAIAREEFPEDLRDLNYAIRGRLSALADNYMYYSYGPLPAGGAPLTLEQKLRLTFWDTFLGFSESELEDLHRHRAVPTKH